MPFSLLPRPFLDQAPELIRRWTDLASRCGRPDPFCCTPAWQLAFHDAFAPSRPLFFQMEEENLLAFAQMQLSNGIPVLTPLETEWISGAPLLGPESDELLLAALPRIRALFNGALPCILIGGMEKDSPVLQRLLSLREFRVIEQPESWQRSASLEGGMDGYLSRRSGNFRAKMKKAKRRAEENGIVFERHVPGSMEEADRLYARMLAVEERSWKGMERCGMTVPPSREFYQIMMRRLARNGCGRVMFAVQDGRDVGFIFGGLAGAFYRGQQFSYDNALRPLSIGDLLQLEQLSWLCGEGVRRYDMGMSDHPSMKYKEHWAELEHSQHAWLLLPMRPAVIAPPHDAPAQKGSF